VGSQTRPLESVDCTDLLDRVIRDLGQAIADQGAAITHDPLPTVPADPLLLSQLFQNLLSNAIKFHGADPPRVHIWAVRDGEMWQFHVQDNGIGIAEEHLERIFAIFQRLHPRSRYPGTGIGLAICKKIVERHGGRIRVDSLPGEGTTFSFTIPAAQQVR
jgi:light-regulated signal transduction histidine kinase (bacteriophytochrome)